MTELRNGSDGQRAGPILSDPGLFVPVRSGRVSEAIVDQLRSLIRSGELPIGTRLPAERDLCKSFGVSRLMIREALRMLEANGLVEIRVGSRGGAFVTSPTPSHITDGLMDLLSTSQLSAVDVTEARRIFELAIVPLVVERATEDDLAELTQLCERTAVARNDGTYTVELSVDFHERVAAATHNPAIAMLMNSLRDAVTFSLVEAHHEGTLGVDEHRAFVDAVRDRNVTKATEVLLAHLGRTAERLRERPPRPENQHG